MRRFLDFLYSASVRQWAIILCPISMTANVDWLIYLIRNGWPNDREAMHIQLTTLAWFGYIMLTIIAIAVVALTATKFKASGLGGSVDIDSSSDPNCLPLNSSVTETATKTVKRDGA